jgi:hypothetical protein
LREIGQTGSGHPSTGTMAFTASSDHLARSLMKIVLLFNFPEIKPFVGFEESIC